MKICILVATAFLCFQTTQVSCDKERSRGCRTGRCKYKNNRLRFLRDLSKTIYPGTNVIGITLKSLHHRKEGTFATFDAAASAGYDIPKIVCPKSKENIDMLPCPTPDIFNRIHCISYYSLCDRKLQCPNGEDEDPTLCLFHSAVDLYMNQMKNIMYKLNRKTEEMISDLQYNYYNYEHLSGCSSINNLNTDVLAGQDQHFFQMPEGTCPHDEACKDLMKNFVVKQVLKGMVLIDNRVTDAVVDQYLHFFKRAEFPYLATLAI